MRPSPAVALIVLVTSLAPPLDASARAGDPSTPVVFAAAAEGDSSAPGGLGPTTAVPWNPPKAMSGAEPWETALRLPGQIVTLPLTGAGYLMRNGLLKVEASNLVPRIVYLLQVVPQAGLYATPASLGDRTGLGGTLCYAPTWIGQKRAISLELSGSTRKYSSTRFGASLGPASAEYRYDWRPQERFYGIGNESSRDDTSNYAAQAERAQVALSFPFSDEPHRSSIRTWVGQRRMTERTGREEDEDVLSLEQRFPLLAGALNDRVEHLVYGAGAVLDRRAGRPHWSHGYRLAANVERFDQPTVTGDPPSGPALAPPQFTRVRYEAEVGFSFMRDPRTIRLKACAVDQTFSAGSGPLLIPDLATLGGGEALAGFEAGRFRDVDALALKASYIFPLAEHFEFDLHAELGGVYEDVWSAPRLNQFARSYGVALRPRMNSGPLGTIGVDWSTEMVRFHYSLGGVE